MAVEKEIIVAIEFGSSKIRGVAGYKNTDGSVQVLDVEQADARNCIRKGKVYNIDKMVVCLKGIIEKMEAALDLQVDRVFVGIGGQSLQSRKNTVGRQFATKTVISQEIVESLLKSNMGTAYPGYEILDVVPQEYRVGLDVTTEPVGVLGSQIEGTFLNIIARTEVKEYILQCVEACGLEVAGIFIAPMALADCVLTDMERRSGCVLVDFGYGTTTVAVYKSNLLRHLAVIPLGGQSITQDICSQQVEDDEAEKLKLKYGSAYSEAGAEDLTKNVLTNNGRTIEERVLVEIVEAREEEILSNVAAQIRNSGFQDKLLAGVVVSGAAANVQHIDQAISATLKAEKMRFVLVVPLDLHTAFADTITRDGSLNVLLSLLNAGNRDCTSSKPCVAVEPETEEPAGQEPGNVPAGAGGDKARVDESQGGDKEREEHEEKPKPRKKSRIKEWLEKVTKTITEE